MSRGTRKTRLATLFAGIWDSVAAVGSTRISASRGIAKLSKRTGEARLATLFAGIWDSVAAVSSSGTSASCIVAGLTGRTNETRFIALFTRVSDSIAAKSWRRTTAAYATFISRTLKLIDSSAFSDIEMRTKSSIGVA